MYGMYEVAAASANTIDATPLGLGKITGYVTQGSLADSATLGFGTIPRWGIHIAGFNGVDVMDMMDGCGPRQGNWRLESRQNPQAGKPALHAEGGLKYEVGLLNLTKAENMSPPTGLGILFWMV